MRTTVLFSFLLTMTVNLSACGGNTPGIETEIVENGNNNNNNENPDNGNSNNAGSKKMNIKIGSHTFTATLADTPSAKAFAAKLPLTLEMSDYGGFEKIANVGTLPSADRRENSLGLGDIMFYGGSNLVLFYANHGGYSYTRIGKVDDTNGLREALGEGSVTVRWEIANEQATQEEFMKVTDGTYSVVFSLNDTDAAKALYNRLPITTEVSNYGNNEKIFYPNPPLNYGTNNRTGDGPKGTLAFFSPWGNVVMYYTAMGNYPGLYLLGQSISGTDDIEKLSGNIIVTKHFDP